MTNKKTPVRSKAKFSTSPRRSATANRNRAARSRDLFKKRVRVLEERVDALETIIIGHQTSKT